MAYFKRAEFWHRTGASRISEPLPALQKPTALGPVANTDTKLLIYGLFQKGRVLAQDAVRPFGIKTYDVNFDVKSWAFYEAVTDAFLATDGDNEWRDGAVVDAHVYAGYTYDYYFKRHNRRGIDDQGSVTINFVHFFPQSAGFNNAFYDPEDNSMNYGDGDGEEFTFFSASLDIVAHEITHAVTYFS